MLLGRCDWEDFWYVPGGRVEAGETAIDSLRRELVEELGIEAEIGRMLWIIENFFEFDGKSFHEVGLYFAVDTSGLPAELLDDEFTRTEPGGEKLIFCWADLGALPDMRVGPSCLAERLSAIPESTEHIVHMDSLPFERMALDEA